MNFYCEACNVPRCRMHLFRALAHTRARAKLPGVLCLLPIKSMRFVHRHRAVLLTSSFYTKLCSTKHSCSSNKPFPTVCKIITVLHTLFSSRGAVQLHVIYWNHKVLFYTVKVHAPTLIASQPCSFTGEEKNLFLWNDYLFWALNLSFLFSN
jgi:hypothetical protein